MHFRPLRSLTAFAIAAALVGAASSASAGPKDKDAQKLYDAAINEDYLNADFPKAEKKLKDAVQKCGSDGCSAELVGKIHIALGTVFGVGQSKMDEAKSEFVLALKADPKAALDPSLTTPELTKAFEEAKKQAGSGKGKTDKGDKGDQAAPAGDAQHTPPPESAVNTPLPIYIEPSDEVPLSKVTLRYKPFGATQYKSAEMKKMGKGYGVEIPCDDVTTTGDIKYFFAFTGADGEPAGGLGSNKEPFRTTVKNEIEGDAPHLPGKKPPSQCKDKGDCPPGLPGCEDKKGGTGGGKRGDKGWGSSCEQTQECKESLVCLNGTCEEDKGGGGGEGGGGDKQKKRMNLVSVGVQLDMLILNGADNVCSINSDAAASHACFTPGTSNQYFGIPAAVGKTNGVQGGFGYADVRILAGYDRLLSKNVGISVGARIGFAIGGSPTPTNVPMNLSGALPFIPFHGELRATYHIINGAMMEDKKFRPYVFINPIGFAQVNAAVPVTICDTNPPPAGDTAKPCPNNMGRQREMSAYQITGRTFSGLGVGTTFGITPLFGLSAEIKVMFMYPTFGVVFAPTLGPVFNF